MSPEVEISMNGRVTKKVLNEISYKEIPDEAKVEKRGKLTVLSVMGKTKRHKYVRRGYIFALDGKKTAEVAAKVGRPLRPKEIVYTAVGMKDKTVKIGLPMPSFGKNYNPRRTDEFQTKLASDVVQKEDYKGKINIEKQPMTEALERQLADFDGRIVDAPKGKRMSVEEVEDLLFTDFEGDEE